MLDRDLALAQLKTYRLRAPFDGIVTRRFKQKGEAIRQGDPVIELIDISRMKVEGRIPLAQAIRLRPGQNVRVQLIDNNDRTGALPSDFKQATFRGDWSTSIRESAWWENGTCGSGRRSPTRADCSGTA